MQDSLLYQGIATLDKRECREFKKYILSPYYNQRAEVIALFDYLLLGLTQKKQGVSKEAAFAAMFPKEKTYDDYKLRATNSILLQLLEDFWASEALKIEKFTPKFNTIKEYRKRHLEKHLLRTMQETEQQLEKQAFRNATFHWQSYNLLLEKYRLLATQRGSAELNLQAVSNHLDYAYFSFKLQHACASLAHQSIYKIDYQLFMLPEIIAQIENRQLQTFPAIGIYYYAYQCLVLSESEAYFYQLKENLSRFGAFFPAEEIRDLYLLAINYCIKKNNDGKPDFLRFELELYQEGLMNQYLHINGFISRFTYRNVVTLALILGEFDWVALFIENFKTAIEPTHQEANYKYCRARLAYEKKDYKLVFALLQEVEYEEIMISLAAKSLLMKVLYETEAHEALDAHIEAMRIYIRRKAYMGYHQENYLNLIKFTKQLLKINTNDKKEIAELHRTIQDCKALVERKWLLDRLGIIDN